MSQAILYQPKYWPVAVHTTNTALNWATKICSVKKEDMFQTQVKKLVSQGSRPPNTQRNDTGPSAHFHLRPCELQDGCSCHLRSSNQIYDLIMLLSTRSGFSFLTDTETVLTPHFWINKTNFLPTLLRSPELPLPPV